MNDFEDALVQIISSGMSGLVFAKVAVIQIAWFKTFFALPFLHLNSQNTILIRSVDNRIFVPTRCNSCS